MKTLFLLTLFISLISGCTTQLHRIEKWEYKVITFDPMKELQSLEGDDISLNNREQFLSLLNEKQSSFLTEQGKLGWEIIDVENSTYTMRRPLVE
jgi:hypothetical protein